jgi:hypothetical protein
LPWKFESENWFRDESSTDFGSRRASSAKSSLRRQNDNGNALEMDKIITSFPSDGVYLVFSLFCGRNGVSR